MNETWNTQSLLESMRQFQPACIIAAAAELNLFTSLATQAQTVVQLAQTCRLDQRALTIVLDALVSLELLQKQNDEYVIPPHLVNTVTGPQSVLPGIRHLANCLRRWSRLSEVVQSGTPADVPPSILGPEGDLTSFIQAMNCFTAPVVEDVINTLPPYDIRHILDIGGASGNWTIGFLKAYPEARATIFDLTDVIPMAVDRIKAASMEERVTFVAGDYHRDSLPPEIDLVWLSAIAHQNSRAENQRLFQKIHTALNDNGCLLIRDIVLDDSRTQPVSGALFAVNMLVATPGGNSYSFMEYQEDLKQAGFSQIELIREDEGMNALIEARP